MRQTTILNVLNSQQKTDEQKSYTAGAMRKNRRSRDLRPAGSNTAKMCKQRAPPFECTTAAGRLLHASSFAQQARLKPTLKANDSRPLTEGRSSGGTRLKPSRLYGPKVCSSRSINDGIPYTVT